MKIIFLTFAIYAYACAVSSITTTEEHFFASRRSMEDAIKEKCFENSHNESTYQNFREASEDHSRCQNNVLNERIPHPVEQHDKFCRYFEDNHFYSCVENFANSALPCLNKSETFFPYMILEAYNTTFDTFCGSNGLPKTEYVFNKLKKNNECIIEALRTIIIPGKCFENLTTFRNYIQNVVDLNQQDYCSDMESFLDCTTKFIEQQCDENISIFKLYFSDLFLSVCTKLQDL